MEEILADLGFIGLDDFDTIISENSFYRLDYKKVQNLLDLYNIDRVVQDNEESKFRNLNLVLMLKYGLLIDAIKNFDARGVGFQLEPMP